MFSYFNMDRGQMQGQIPGNARLTEPGPGHILEATGGERMTDGEFFFFNGHPGALGLYEALTERFQRELGDFEIKAAKTQISFCNPRGFAFVSFLPVRKAKDRPRDFLTLTYGLGRRSDWGRVDQANQPYPGRWTHHVLLSSPEEIDGELMAQIKEAYAFAAAKGRRS